MLLAISISSFLICGLTVIVAVPVIRWAETIESASCSSIMKSLGLIDSVAARSKYKNLNTTERMRIPKFYLLGDSTLRIKAEYAMLAGIAEFFIYDPPKDYTIKLWTEQLDNPFIQEHMMWADVIVWNIGLHKQGPSFPSDLAQREGSGSLSSLGEYENMLRNMTAKLLSQIKMNAHNDNEFSYQTLVYYKLTNSMCFQKRDIIRQYMYDPNYTMRPEYEMQRTRAGSPMLNYVEKKVMREYNITVLNTFTSNACPCSVDGMHYVPLCSGFVDKLISIAQKDLLQIQNAPYNKRLYPTE